MYSADHGVERVVADVLGPELAVDVDDDPGSDVAKLDPHDRAGRCMLLLWS